DSGSASGRDDDDACRALYANYICIVHQRMDDREAVRLTRTSEMGQQASLDRFRILVDAGIALSSELSLDALLQPLVETAAKLTGARYAALGVIDRSGPSLERFLTTGIAA